MASEPALSIRLHHIPSTCVARGFDSSPGTLELLLQAASKNATAEMDSNCFVILLEIINTSIPKKDGYTSFIA